MQEDFTVKVLGYLRVSRAVAPYMQQNRWGRIIHLSGLAARFAGNISAGFRNAAVVHLSKSMAHALGPNGITTNALLPALVATESLNERLAAQAGYMGLSPEALLDSNIQQTPIRRLVTADDIANVAVFCLPLLYCYQWRGHLCRWRYWPGSPLLTKNIMPESLMFCFLPLTFTSLHGWIWLPFALLGSYLCLYLINPKSTAASPRT